MISPPSAASAALPGAQAALSSNAVPSTRTASTRHHSYPTSLVWLNIYDITFYNDFLLPILGIGVFHSSLEVYGTEFGFGRAASGPGLFAIEPQSYPGHVYRESICLGETKLSESEVWGLHLRHNRIWRGDFYRILDCNCNDYSYEFGRLLVSAPNAEVANRWVGEMEKKFFADAPQGRHPALSLDAATVIQPPRSAQGTPVPCETTFGGRLPLLRACSACCSSCCCGGCCSGQQQQEQQDFDDIFPSWLNRITRVANWLLPRKICVGIENADRHQAGMQLLTEKDV